MLNRNGLVTSTEHQQLSSRLIKAVNWDNKNDKRHTQSKLILLFNKTSYFTSNFTLNNHRLDL